MTTKTCWHFSASYLLRNGCKYQPHLYAVSKAEARRVILTMHPDATKIVLKTVGRASITSCSIVAL